MKMLKRFSTLSLWKTSGFFNILNGFHSLFLCVITISISMFSFLIQLDFLPAECFPLTFDLNYFSSKTNGYMPSISSNGYMPSISSY